MARRYRRGVRRLLLLATVAAVGALGLAACTPSGDESAAKPVVDGAREIEVDATSFAFDPEEITVQAGEDVTIVLHSDDIFHDFVVDEAGGTIVGANDGNTKKGGLKIEKPGRYTFYCDVSGHQQAGMEGTLVVE